MIDKWEPLHKSVRSNLLLKQPTLRGKAFKKEKKINKVLGAGEVILIFLVCHMSFHPP